MRWVVNPLYKVGKVSVSLLSVCIFLSMECSFVVCCFRNIYGISRIVNRSYCLLGGVGGQAGLLLRSSHFFATLKLSSTNSGVKSNGVWGQARVY